MKKYNPEKIERAWQKIWYNSTAFKAQNGSKKKKFYLLDEFPYPSGDGLHVGHCRPYIGLDVIARKRRMQGQNVLFPMGWDAFGLPTENYAIKTGVQPAVATKKNTANFKRQMQMLGLSFDWSREINTTDSAYYKWTQWIFIQLFKKGLAYKAKININWCPKDKTGLANEEVINGKCERCGTPVEKKEKEQWLIKITKYADRLIKDLEKVDYPVRVKDQQINWIGRSEGAEITFQLQNTEHQISVFTTRPDTLFGCTFLVLAPEHPVVKNIQHKILNWNEAEAYITKTQNKSDLARQEEKEKTGVLLQGVKAINPVNKQEIPIFIADYVLMGYGTGAIMAVPAHDQRDFEFAKKYQLPVTEVVIPNIIDKKNPPVAGKKVVERKNIHAIVKDPATGKYLALKWKRFPWITFPMGGIEEGEDLEQAARREVREESGYTNLKFIKVLDGTVRAEYFAAHKDENRVAFTRAVLFELIDHQQVPVSEKESSGHEIFWLSEHELNYQVMTHAEVDEWNKRLHAKLQTYEGDGILINSDSFNSLDSQKAKTEITKFVGGKITTTYKLRDWVFSRQHYWGEPIPMVYCQTCKWVPVTEKQLPIELPKVKQYHPTDDGQSPLSAITKWVNTTCPECGQPAKRETDTMPNWAGSNWYYLAYTMLANQKAKGKIQNYQWNTKNMEYWMPVDWYNGGMEHTTLHLLYSRFIFKFLWDIGAVPKKIGNEPYKKRTSHGIVLAEGGVKMSKSKGNVINPDDVVKKYGADTLRAYEMFMGPFEQMIPWDEKGIVGVRRFLEKVYSIANLQAFATKKDPALESVIHKTIKKVSEDIESMKFNTAISSLMILTNQFYENPANVHQEQLKLLLLLLSPFAPHLAEELWKANNFKGLCSQQAWPKANPKLLKEERVTLIVQINGKVRDKIEVLANIDQGQAEGIVTQNPKIKNIIGSNTIKKFIFIPNKIINIVI